MSRTRTIAKEIDPAALVDRMVQATNTIHENEERMRACRRQFIKAGGR